LKPYLILLLSFAAALPGYARAVDGYETPRATIEVEVYGQRKVPVSVLTRYEYGSILTMMLKADELASGFSMNGCVQRSYLIAHALDQKGISVVQIEFDPNEGYISTSHSVHPLVSVDMLWSKHVASAVFVESEEGKLPTLMMIDPSFLPDGGSAKYWEKRLRDASTKKRRGHLMTFYPKHQYAASMHPRATGWDERLLEYCRDILLEQKAALEVLRGQHFDSDHHRDRD
jgi:hypothetical protein